jgi:hypothetical protein
VSFYFNLKNLKAKPVWGQTNQLRKSDRHCSRPNYISKKYQVTGQSGHQLIMLPTPDPFWGGNHVKFQNQESKTECKSKIEQKRSKKIGK